MSPPNLGYKQTGKLTAADSNGSLAVVASTGQSKGGGVQLSGTFVGTVQFEQTLDNGLTWIAKTVYPALGGSGVTSATGTGQWKFACGGETQVRVRCSAYTSGTIGVDMTETAGLDVVAIPQATTAAVAPSGASTDGSTAIATGGTAQNLFGGTTPTNGWAVYNPDASETLWVSDTTTAAPNGQGSIPVFAGSGYETPAGRKPLGPVSVYGATTGHKITASRW